MSNLSNLRHKLQNGLIASCQPVPGSAMDTPEIVAAMACAALAGGAVGLRIEGISNIQAVRRATDAPLLALLNATCLTPRSELPLGWKISMHSVPPEQILLLLMLPAVSAQSPWPIYISERGQPAA